MGLEYGTANSFEALRLLWSLWACGIMLVAPPHEMVQSEGDFVGMHRAPGDDALQLDAIIGNRADLHEFGFDDVSFPHITFSMAHTAKARLARSHGATVRPPLVSPRLDD